MMERGKKEEIEEMKEKEEKEERRCGKTTGAKAAAKRFGADLKQWIWFPPAFLLYNIAVISATGAFCPMVILTGLPCPGCGMTRALLYAVTGRFADAFSYNACIFLWIPFAVYFFWNRYIYGRKAKYTNLFLILIGSLMIVCYLYRMMTGFPGKEPLVWFEGNVIGKIVPNYNVWIEDVFLK